MNTSFLRILIFSGCTCIVVFVAWLLSTEAWLKQFIDWLHSCCGFFFNQNQIPWSYYLITGLTLCISSVFLYYFFRTFFYTSMLVKQLEKQTSEQTTDVIQIFSKNEQVVITTVEHQELFAFVYGWWKPKMMVSTALIQLLTPTELKAVLYHELYHSIHKDPWQRTLTYSFAQALFFLPIIKKWQHAFIISSELAADRFAIRQTDRRALATALYKVISSTSSLYDQTGFAHFHTKQIIDLRIEQLISGNKAYDPFPLDAWLISILNITMIITLITQLFLSMTTHWMTFDLLTKGCLNTTIM